jgi:hypothetical protein
MNMRTFLAFIVGVSLTVAAIYFWQMQRTPGPLVLQAPTAVPALPTDQAQGGVVERVQMAPEQAPTSTVQDDAHLIVPPATITGSDEKVKAVVSELMPGMLAWFTPEEQIRKWVTVVDGVADNKFVFKHQPIKADMAVYSAQEVGDKWFADNANYPRLNGFIDALTQIPPQKLARYYRYWQPLLDNAYAELGRGGSFNERLMLAFQQIEATETLPAGAELIRPSVMYRYADPELENTSSLVKALWRIGPENTRKLQDFIKILRPLLSVDVPAEMSN